MWLPVLGLLIGLVAGSLASVEVPAQYSRYTAMAILASLDSVLGAARAEPEGTYNLVCLSRGSWSMRCGQAF